MIVRLLQSVIRAYKKLFSPHLHSSCRFTPTCSDYALEALERHGPFLGSALTLWRILRCNPFSAGGLDTVPMRVAISSPSVLRGTPMTLQSDGVDPDAKLHSRAVRIPICNAGEVARDGALN
jgi:putative membrane protein insertion efficiency factor